MFESSTSSLSSCSSSSLVTFCLHCRHIIIVTGHFYLFIFFFFLSHSLCFVHLCLHCHQYGHIFQSSLSWPKQIILANVTVVFITFVTTIVVIIIIYGHHCNHCCCPLSLWSLVISQPCYFSLNSHYFPPKNCLVYINITVLIITVLHHRIAGMTGTAACNWNNWKSRLEDGLAVV